MKNKMCILLLIFSSFGYGQAFDFITRDGVTKSMSVYDSATVKSAIKWIATGSDIYYSTGKVGIGVAAPIQLLDIRGTSSAPTGSSAIGLGFLQLLSTNAAAAGVGPSITFGGETGHATLTPRTFGSIQGAKTNSTTSDFGGYLSFSTATGGGVNTERLRIDASGVLIWPTDNSTDIGGGAANRPKSIFAGTSMGTKRYQGTTIANDTTAIQGNSATSGNTATNASIVFNVDNNGGRRAMTLLNNGNLGIGGTTPSSKVVVSGALKVDSMAQRRFVVGGDSHSTNWFAYLRDSANLGFPTMVQTSVSGRSISDVYTNYLTEGHLYRPTAAGDYCIYAIVAGINDLTGLNLSKDTVWNRLKVIYALARADGYKVLAQTIIYSDFLTSNPTKVANFYAVNDSIRLHPELYDFLADVGVQFNYVTDATAYTDQTHLTTAGYRTYVGIIQSALDYKPFNVLPIGAISTSPKKMQMVSKGAVTVIDSFRLNIPSKGASKYLITDANGWVTATSTIPGSDPLKVNYTDTTSMLAGYQTAINTNTTAIATKLNKNDTTAMLAGYYTLINSHTTSISGMAPLASNNTFTANGALSSGSGPAMKLSGTWITGGSTATTKPMFLIEPSGASGGTYSTAGTGLGINAPSGFTGDLFNFTVNGVARASMNTSGSLALTTGSFTVTASDAQITAGKLTMVAKQIFYGATMTAGGTTGAQTINKPTGSVNFAAGASSLVVTNSLVTTTSIVMPVIMTNDATALIKNVVVASGSFTITLNANATAETKVGFLVVN